MICADSKLELDHEPLLSPPKSMGSYNAERSSLFPLYAWSRKSLFFLRMRAWSLLHLAVHGNNTPTDDSIAYSNNRIHTRTHLHTHV